MTRASYKKGIAWIAMNDDLGSEDAFKVESVADYISTSLLADLFGVDRMKVARDIVIYRSRYCNRLDLGYIHSC